jgi:hypothetical protein
MFNGAGLFWYRLVFMLELLTAEFIFTFKLKRRSYYWLRLVIYFLACCGFSFAIPILSYSGYYIFAMFLIFFLLTVLGLYFTYQEPWSVIIFLALASYTTQHIAYETFNLIIVACDFNKGQALNLYGSTTWSNNNPFIVFEYIIYFITYYFLYWLIYALFGKKIKKGEEIILQNVQLLPLVGLVIIVDIFLSSVLNSYSYEVYNQTYIIMFTVTNIICCLVSLVVQFRLIFSNKLAQELDTATQLMHQKQEQYSISKENIELINLKCHDLKHQIHQIANTSSLNPKAVSDIENIVSIYDSNVKTGNEALDIILTEKSLLCNKNGIKLTCIVDGEKLSFIDQADLYSLFGNAIDNAIEAVINLPEDKRVIGLNVREVESFISINIHNYFNEELSLSFKDGIPLTTKKDKAYHGFGMKSIQMVTQKYSGDLSIDAENHIFNLNILFPVASD